MATLVEFMIIAGANNRPLMLEKSMYDSWKSRMELYMENRENGRMILNSVQNVPLGLPLDVYAIFNHFKVEKEIWDRVKLLMQGMKLSLQERECKLYDEFDKFSFVKGETLYHYYWRFAQVINNMNVINMLMRPVQVNTKLLNSLPPEWSKFVTDVKLARDLHTTNYDQLYSYLEQHEAHANETRLMRNDTKILLHLMSISINYRLTLPTIFLNTMLHSFLNRKNHDSTFHSPQSYLPILAFLVFTQRDDPISCLNKVMAFLSIVVASRQSYNGTSNKGNATSLGGNNAGGRKGLLNAIIVKVKDTWLGNVLSLRGKGTLHSLRTRKCWLKHKNLNEDLDAYDSDCDDVSNAKADLMANLSNYGSDVILEEKANQKKNNESLTAEIKRYKKRVKTFEQRRNIDLSTREKMIDSQMDDMIKEKLALKQQIYPLEQKLSNQIKEKEFYCKHLLFSKMNPKKKKPQVFYDDTHKQAIGYQNLFYLKKAHRIKPTLYDGSVISSQIVVIPVIDNVETLILEEVSPSKMLAKQKD
nr:hypothetical protein [Tanacetum cinerariifolium]